MGVDTNIVIEKGRLGGDPEVRTFQDGGKITNFSIAVGDDYKSKDKDWVNRTYWFDVKTNRKVNIGKGDMVLVSGKLVQEKWKARDGSKRSRVVIAAHKVESLEKRESTGNGQASYQSEGFQSSKKPIDKKVKVPADGMNSVEEDDLPF